MLIIETIVLLFPLASGAEEHSHKSSTTALGTDCLDFLIKSLFFKLKKIFLKIWRYLNKPLREKAKDKKIITKDNFK